MLIDEGFAWLILEIVREIPCGKVATYGQIAKLAGHPRHSRAFGHVLAHAEHFGDYPCHRVVNASGRTAPGWTKQRALLEAEGVTFLPNGNADLKHHQWKP